MQRRPEYTIQRLRGGFAVVYHDDDGKRRRQQLAATDKPGAEAEARQRWRLGDKSPWTVGRIVTAYMADREREGIASASRQKDAWKAMASYWDQVSPGLIDRPMAQAYVAKRQRAAATTRYELQMLSAALKWARKARYITEAPDIWYPAPPARRERHLTRAQFRKLLDHVRAPHARLYMMLAVTTCARPSALLELTWDRVDFEHQLIDLNPHGRVQTKKRRPTIPIADRMLPDLQAAAEARQSDFVIERSGQRIASVKKAFQAASERSGVDATPYTLRHTGAVWRAEDGVSMAEIAQLMGHDDSRTTERHYARFSPNFLRKAANAGGW